MKVGRKRAKRINLLILVTYLPFAQIKSRIRRLRRSVPLAFRAAASFNLRVQPSGSASFTEKLFTPVRFGILLALLVIAMFPQVILGLETFVVRDYGFFAYPLAYFQQECFRLGERPFWNPYDSVWRYIYANGCKGITSPF